MNIIQAGVTKVSLNFHLILLKSKFTQVNDKRMVSPHSSQRIIIIVHRRQ